MSNCVKLLNGYTLDFTTIHNVSKVIDLFAEDETGSDFEGQPTWALIVYIKNSLPLILRAYEKKELTDLRNKITNFLTVQTNKL